MQSANSFYLQDRDDKLKAKFQKIKNDLPPDLHVGDFRTLSPQKIANASVDLVFIDPPYDDEAIPLYGAAAKEAARILKPGGSLISYCGQLQLPVVLPAMLAHLKYYWIGAHVHADGQMARMTQYGIIVGLKPLLWFVKDYRFDRQTYVKDAVLVSREKHVHPWQQVVKTAEHFIAALTTTDGSLSISSPAGEPRLSLPRIWVAAGLHSKSTKKQCQVSTSVNDNR